MTKKRYVSTSFWDDWYIVNLDPIEKLLFLYFMTNPLTKICGIYEISTRRISFDTWIDKDMVLKIIDRLSEQWKIFYIDWWIYIRNFQKHQNLNNIKIQKWIESEMQLIPNEIKNKILVIDKSYMSHIWVSNNIDIDLDSDIDLDTIDSKAETSLTTISNKKEITEKINNLISMIKNKCLEIWIAYDKNQDRNFAKHILTAKDYWEFCDNISMTREELAVAICDVSVKTSYWKWARSWPKTIYQDYADVYNTAKKNITNNRSWVSKF